MPPFWRKNNGFNQPSEIANIGSFLAKLRGSNPLIIAENIRLNTQQVFPKLGELYT
jgi:hypothetical protein